MSPLAYDSASAPSSASAPRWRVSSLRLRSRRSIARCRAARSTSTAFPSYPAETCRASRASRCTTRVDAPGGAVSGVVARRASFEHAIDRLAPRDDVLMTLHQRRSPSRAGGIGILPQCARRGRSRDSAVSPMSPKTPVWPECHLMRSCSDASRFVHLDPGRAHQLRGGAPADRLWADSLSHGWTERAP